MCVSLKMRIKSVSPQGVQHAFIPCGKCLECRLSQQFGWTTRFRLAVQAMENDSTCGCHVGFGTLTYNEEHLPHVPHVLVSDSKKESYPITPCCFDRDHVRGLIKRVRDWLYDTYDIKKPTYLLCCEYGEHTQRPHYHFAFACPLRVDMFALHALIKRYWCDEKDYGFICPKDFEGSREHKIKPFVALNNSHVVGYVTKYTCKDIKFYEYLKKDDFVKKFEVVDGETGELLETVRLADYVPFHMQSRCLGSGFIDSLSESEKLVLLRDGFQFVGESKLHSLPKYFKDKILYKNIYKKKPDGSRLVRRKPTHFFVTHVEDVYECKRKSVEEVMRKWLSSDYWFNLRGKDKVSKDLIKIYESLKADCHVSPLQLSHYYLSFFGVPWEKCRVDIPFYSQWFCRFFEKDVMPSKKDYLLIDPILHYNMSNLLRVCHELENDILEDWRIQALKMRRNEDYVKQFHLNH